MIKSQNEGKMKWELTRCTCRRKASAPGTKRKSKDTRENRREEGGARHESQEEMVNCCGIERGQNNVKLTISAAYHHATRPCNQWYIFCASILFHRHKPKPGGCSIISSALHPSPSTTCFVVLDVFLTCSRWSRCTRQ